MKNFLGHSFHIPVLGIGYSIDTPLKAAPYGISSVISLVDDTLLEQIREKLCIKFDMEFEPIPENSFDSRARRITEYLNIINKGVKERFEQIRNSAFEVEDGIKKYLEMLPDYSELKKNYKLMLTQKDAALKEKLAGWIRDHLYPGSIDVNIMTKLDREKTGKDGKTLPSEFNEAHAALRGFAMSDLESSVVFSAGMNPRLYSYAETFKDFFPDKLGRFRKKITIKVSDFRSALIQGKFLAKKGLWVNEFRIESGLNCGGHAFATDGYLLGSILDEFKTKRDELVNSLRDLFIPALKNKGIESDCGNLDVKITVQGGVGTGSEHSFLLRKYDVDSVGWGTPFLLVPEVTNIDEPTLDLLSRAGEKDLYLSNISPLGVPFNSVRGNSKDEEKFNRIKEGKPGSPCTKKFLMFKTGLSEKPMCTASIAYIKEALKFKNNSADKEKAEKDFNNTLDKACLCEGLTASAIITNNVEQKRQGLAVSVCPGPNMAYFSKIVSLREMVDHIYGRTNLITVENRPNVFMKELDLYINYFQNRLKEKAEDFSKQTEEYFTNFKNNINKEIEYYKTLIPDIAEETEKVREKIKTDLENLENKFISIFGKFGA